MPGSLLAIERHDGASTGFTEQIDAIPPNGSPSLPVKSFKPGADGFGVLRDDHQATGKNARIGTNRQRIAVSYWKFTSTN